MSGRATVEHPRWGKAVIPLQRAKILDSLERESGAVNRRKRISLRHGTSKSRVTSYLPRQSYAAPCTANLTCCNRKWKFQTALLRALDLSHWPHHWKTGAVYSGLWYLVDKHSSTNLTGWRWWGLARHWRHCTGKRRTRRTRCWTRRDKIRSRLLGALVQAFDMR